MENKNNFKVMKRSDYKAPAYTALNADLTFDLSDDRTIVKSKVTYRRLLTDSRPSLILNTEESEIVSVKINDVSVDISSNSFVNNLKKNIIELQTPNESEFVVEIENAIDHVQFLACRTLAIALASLHVVLNGSLPVTLPVTFVA